jgi:hypothetical protein
LWRAAENRTMSVHKRKDAGMCSLDIPSNRYYHMGADSEAECREACKSQQINFGLAGSTNPNDYEHFECDRFAWSPQVNRCYLFQKIPQNEDDKAAQHDGFTCH